MNVLCLILNVIAKKVLRLAVLRCFFRPTSTKNDLRSPRCSNMLRGLQSSWALRFSISSCDRRTGCGSCRDFALCYVLTFVFFPFKTGKML